MRVRDEGTAAAAPRPGRWRHGMTFGVTESGSASARCAAGASVVAAGAGAVAAGAGAVAAGAGGAGGGATGEVTTLSRWSSLAGCADDRAVREAG